MRFACFGLLFWVVGIPLHGLRSEGPDLGRQVKVDSSPLPKEGSVPLSYASVVEKSLPSVVTVLVVKYENLSSPGPANSPNNFDLGGDDTKAREPQPVRGSGSGVILTRNGYILTNNHVVDGADSILVRLPGREPDLEAKLMGRDPLTDVALLKVEAEDLSPITVADSAGLRRGDVVLALGSPFGLEQTVTMGIISATGRAMGYINNGYEDFIQTDAPINPGNSGGALVDGLGRLVGINTATFTGGWMPAQGIGFAVPSNLALRVAKDLLRHGHVVRGYMGVQWTEVSEEEALKITGRPDVRPARIVALEAGTPAEKAGFQGGDIVLALNGHPVPSLAKARYAVATLLPGSKAVFTVQRGQEKRTVEVTLIETPDAAVAEADRPPPEPRPLVVQEGLEVAALSNKAKADSKAPAEMEGVLVTRAEENGKPMTKLGAGDIVMAINGHAVQEPEGVRDLFSAATPGKSFMFHIWRQGVEDYVMLRKK